MAWCLMAPSQYLNQFSLNINKVLWHSPSIISQEMLKISKLDMSLKITNLILQSHLPGANELICCHYKHVLIVPQIPAPISLLLIRCWYKIFAVCCVFYLPSPHVTFVWLWMFIKKVACDNWKFWNKGLFYLHRFRQKLWCSRHIERHFVFSQLSSLWTAFIFHVLKHFHIPNTRAFSIFDTAHQRDTFMRTVYIDFHCVWVEGWWFTLILENH